MLKVFSSPVGSYMTNCYVAVDEKSGLAAAFDCAVFNAEYKKLLLRAGVNKLDYIILTHGHFDHICGVSGLKEYSKAKVIIHTDDYRCLVDERYNLNNLVAFAEFNPCTPDEKLNGGDTISLGETDFKVISTPGHTPGSCCFDTGRELFSGDTLFKLSMGRTDFPRGSEKDMFLSLKKLAALEGERTVYTGHGETTLLSIEKQFNPYMSKK